MRVLIAVSKSPCSCFAALYDSFMPQPLKSTFAAQGYVTNLEIIPADAIALYCQQFDAIESAEGRKTSQIGITNRHKTNPILGRLVTDPRILDAMEQILGPDLLLLGSHFFCKYPDLSESFVAWHQDVTYWGLTPPKAATLWLAIDDADPENGCMRVIPESHRGKLLPHGKSQHAGNLLSGNQEIPDNLVNASSAVYLPLRAGCASIHDGMLIHGSNPNRSTRRRCGLTLRFTTPDVVPAVGVPGAVQWKAELVRGADRHGHFKLDP